MVVIAVHTERYVFIPDGRVSGNPDVREPPVGAHPPDPVLTRNLS